MILRLFTLLACLLILTPAQAQVNIERERAGALKEGLHISLDGSMSLIRGNVSLSQVGLMGKAQWVKGVHQPFVQGSIAYGEREQVAFLDQSFGHARWTSMWHERAGSELFAQLQEDAFRSLVLRQLYGGGGRFVVGEWDAGSLALGVGYMFEREDYRDTEGRTRQELNHRSTNYLALSHTLKAATQLTFSDMLYIQPKLNELGDYRALNDMSLEVKLSEHVRLVESLSLMYDSAPPPNVRRVDLKSTTALRITL